MVSHLKIVTGVPADQPTWLPLLKVEHRGKINKKNSIKKYPEKLCDGVIASKLRWNDTFVITFKNYGWRPEPPSNMAVTVTENRTFDKKMQKLFF